VTWSFRSSPLEHDARLIGESFGRKTIRLVVDPGHPPAVAVADLIDPVTGTSGADVDGAVVASAHDDVTEANLLVTRGFCGTSPGSAGP
jgi:hypothetical protein